MQKDEITCDFPFFLRQFAAFLRTSCTINVPTGPPTLGAEPSSASSGGIGNGFSDARSIIAAFAGRTLSFRGSSGSIQRRRDESAQRIRGRLDRRSHALRHALRLAQYFPLLLSHAQIQQRRGETTKGQIEGTR